MPRRRMPMLAVIGVAVLAVAVAAALVVALLRHQEEIPATWIEDGQIRYGLLGDCGNALAPTGSCPEVIADARTLAGTIATVGVVLGVGLMVAGYQIDRGIPPPPAAPDAGSRPTS